jgi:hypothetical protein
MKRQSSLTGMKKLPPTTRVGPGSRAQEKLPPATRAGPGARAQEKQPRATSVTPGAQAQAAAAAAGTEQPPHTSDAGLDTIGNGLINSELNVATPGAQAQAAAAAAGTEQPLHTSDAGLDTIGNGLINSELNVEEGFDAFDIDEDGVVSLDDFLSAIQELQLPFSHDFSMALFQSLASSPAGGGAQTISRDTWVAAMAPAVARVRYEVLHNREILRNAPANLSPGKDVGAAQPEQGDGAVPAKQERDADIEHAVGDAAAGGADAPDVAQEPGGRDEIAAAGWGGGEGEGGGGGGAGIVTVEGGWDQGEEDTVISAPPGHEGVSNTEREGSDTQREGSDTQREGSDTQREGAEREGAEGHTQDTQRERAEGHTQAAKSESQAQGDGVTPGVEVEGQKESDTQEGEGGGGHTQGEGQTVGTEAASGLGAVTVSEGERGGGGGAGGEGGRWGGGAGGSSKILSKSVSMVEEASYRRKMGEEASYRRKKLADLVPAPPGFVRYRSGLEHGSATGLQQLEDAGRKMAEVIGHAKATQLVCHYFSKETDE